MIKDYYLEETKPDLFDRMAMRPISRAGMLVLSMRTPHRGTKGMQGGIKEI